MAMPNLRGRLGRSSHRRPVSLPRLLVVRSSCKIRLKQLESLATTAGLSMDARAFKRSMGVPPHSYVPRRRIECAKDMSSMSGIAALSPRERSILGLIGQGQSNKEIARVLRIAPETVKSHVKNMFAKLGVERRAQAVYRAQSLLDGGGCHIIPGICRFTRPVSRATPLTGRGERSYSTA